MTTNVVAPASQDRLVSKREACALLGGISLGTLNSMLRCKKLPSRYVGRRRFIPLAAIRRYIERGPTTAFPLTPAPKKRAK